MDDEIQPLQIHTTGDEIFTEVDLDEEIKSRVIRTTRKIIDFYLSKTLHPSEFTKAIFENDGIALINFLNNEYYTFGDKKIGIHLNGIYNFFYEPYSKLFIAYLYDISFNLGKSTWIGNDGRVWLRSDTKFNQIEFPKYRDWLVKNRFDFEL
jgi:hypothetical protein